MIKKVLAMAAAAVLALSLSACGGAAVKVPALTFETSSGSSSGAEEAVREKPAKTYEDTLAGLLAYMKDGKAIAFDTEGVTFDNGAVVIAEGVTAFTQMSYKEIGAVNGYRCQFSFGGGTMQVEFYEFDPENLDEKAQACIGSVREKGFFEILGSQVRAVLHPSEKYLMIYTDPNAEKSDENKQQKAWAEELFLGFQQ